MIAAAARSLIAEDINGDGHLDLIGLSGPQIFVLAGNGSGGFAAPLYFGGNTASGHDKLRAGDFDGDGKLDLACVDQTNGDLVVWRNLSQ